jgi:hypothetical protein
MCQKPKPTAKKPGGGLSRALYQVFDFASQAITARLVAPVLKEACNSGCRFTMALTQYALCVYHRHVFSFTVYSCSSATVVSAAAILLALTNRNGNETDDAALGCPLTSSGASGLSVEHRQIGELPPLVVLRPASRRAAARAVPAPTRNGALHSR